MRKYNYVYITTNKINGKFYIGKHSTDNLNDNYLGSGIMLNKAIKKYGKENFKKRILCFCESEEQAFEVEKFLVTEYIVSREDCYNLHIGGDGGKMNPEICRQHSVKMKEYYKTHSPWNKGMKMDAEFCKKVSEANKKRTSQYIRTPEHRELMRKIQTGKKHNFTDESYQRLIEGASKAGAKIKGTKHSKEWIKKSVPHCLYLDENGIEHIMTKLNASRYHKNWIFIKVVD